MIHEAYMPVYRCPDFHCAGGRGSTRGSTRGPRGPKNVTNAGSQLTWEGGRAGINKNVTDTKLDRRGVTTDLLDV